MMEEFLGWKYWSFALLLMILSTACVRNNNASIELSGLNYTNVGIAAFSVDGYEGHSIFPNGGGGKFVCCVTILRKWRVGTKVTVRWVEDAVVLGPWKERVVEVPEYTKQDIGVFAVHFYPDGTVKVLVTAKMEGHPDYPYPRPN
ncbi:DUF3304 domain-containing protein [Massilia consociata]